MKWHRIAPGQYELLRDGGRIGIVERSKILPRYWWWAAWGNSVDARGLEGSLCDAKDGAAEALATEEP